MNNTMIRTGQLDVAIGTRNLWTARFLLRRTSCRVAMHIFECQRPSRPRKASRFKNGELPSGATPTNGIEVVEWFEKCITAAKQGPPFSIGCSKHSKGVRRKESSSTQEEKGI